VVFPERGNQLGTPARSRSYAAGDRGEWGTLEEALLRRPDEPAEPVRSALKPNWESLRWGLERDGAPFVVRDAVLALLDEARASARRDRWATLIALAGVAVSIATLLVVLFR
jgi:hypothetical protein